MSSQLIFVSGDQLNARSRFKLYLEQTKMENKFSKIYKKNIWGGGSGTGSKMSPDNKWYLDLLTQIIGDHQVKTVADVGCGDFNILQNIQWERMDVDYLGMDCVGDLITQHNEEFGWKQTGSRKRFVKKDITQDPKGVKGYDLVILKDVIQHWDDQTIQSVLQHLVQNNKMVLIGNGYKFGRTPQKNNWETRDINNKYSYHPVDIQKEPLRSMDLKVILKKERRYKQFCLINQTQQ